MSLPDPERRSELPAFDPRRPKPVWRKWLIRCLLLLLSLAAAGAFTSWYLLRTEAGRRWLLERVSAEVETTGWHFDAHDFSLRLRPGRLVLQGVRFGAPGAEPLIAIDRVEAEFFWQQLRQGPRVIERARVSGLVVKTTAPVPNRRQADPGSQPAPFPLAVRNLELRDAEVLGGITEGWLETWSVRDLSLDGAIGDGGFEAGVSRGILRLVRRDSDDLDLDLSGQARGPLEGPYTLQNVDVEGDGLDIEGSGTAGLGVAEPLSADFHLRADAARLLGRALPSLLPPADPSSDPSGVLQAQGSFDFRDLEGRFELDLENVPVEIFEPLVGSESLDRIAARGTHIDGKAEVEVAFGVGVASAERVRGNADLTWRRNGEPLVEVHLRTLGTSRPGGPIRIAVDAHLLPRFSGIRRMEASLLAPSWSRLADLRTDIATVTLNVPDLASFRDLLARRWPTALANLPEMPWQGRLDLRTELGGSLRDPLMRGGGTWQPEQDSVVELSADGRPLSARGTATIKMTNLDLAVLRQSLGVAELAGRLDGTVDIDLRQQDAERVAADGRLELADVILRLDGSSPPDLLATALAVEGEASIPWQGSMPSFGSLRADARLGARDLEAPTRHRVASLEVDAQLLDGDLRLRRAAGAVLVPLAPPAPLGAEMATEPRRFADALSFEVAGTARFLGDTAWLHPVLDRFDLRLSGDPPQAAVDRVEFDARLQDGVLGIDLVTLDLPADGPMVETLSAYLPLADLGRLPGLEGFIGSLPISQRASGPLRIAFDLPGLDTGELHRWLGLEPPAEQLRASLSGGLHIEPADPTASTGRITVRDAEVELAQGTFRSAEVQTVSLENRRVRLERGLWHARNRSFDAEAQVDLESGWRLDDPLTEAIDTFSAVATGSLEVSLLNGYLAGGRAQGLAEVTVLAAGTPEDHAAEIEVVGDENTTFSWVSPYATQLSSPTVRLKVEDGVVSITEAKTLLNEGRLDLEGTVWDSDQQTHLSGYLDSVRYRLDYGLTVLLSGNFDLHLYPSQPGELEANILVERGFLRRQVDPDRELLGILLQPPKLDVEDASDMIRHLRLDLDVATIEGLRVKNNVADLHASWAPLEVGGTLDSPFVRGSIEVDPGGKVYAWGQVVRLDRAALEFSGHSDLPTRLDLITTSSLEDPSVATSSDRRLIAEMAEPVPLGSTESEDRRIEGQAITTGLTTYYGDQLASRLGAGLSGPRIEYRPLRIFGESSPEAKLVVSQDLSSNVSLAAAFGLRAAEDRTYLLDFHEFDFLPSLSATAFTSDQSDYGATLQQLLRLGGADALNEDDLPRLDDIVVRCTGCTNTQGEVLASERKIRRAAGFHTDDLIPDGSDFDIEVDVAESLRRQGFPDPEVKADIEPDQDKGYVDVVLDIQVGPRALFDFQGAEPPRNRRDSIRRLYRVDYYEQTALDEMRMQTERVWKSLGHPQPQVTVRAEREDPDDPRSDRRVTIESDPGHKLDLRELRFLPELPAAVTSTLLHRFDSPVWRVKLAAADEDADSRLLRAMTSVGYPQASLEGRELANEGESLTVRLRPGPRRTVESVAILGLNVLGADSQESGGGEMARAQSRLELSVGDPYVSARVAHEAARLESDLRSRGYYEARVHAEVDLDGAEDLGAEVRLIAEPGNRYVLRKIEVRGAVHTKESWIRDITGLELATPLDRQKVAEARRKLVETRLFTRVTVDANHGEDGTTLVFELVEQPRFELAYGGRWESEGGGGAIFEALDNNFAGRGVDLGLRVLYAETEQRARFYSRIPRLFDRGVKLELFAELFDHTHDELESVGWEVTGQLSLRLRPKLEGRVYGRFVDQELTDLTATLDDPERERTPALGVQLVWDSRDRLLDPRRGILASLDLSGARDFIAQENEYLRFYGQINAFIPFFEGMGSGSSRRPPWVWSQSLRLGLAATDDDLPRSVRFFAGGPFSVRGYRERELGPFEANADGSLRARGGQALLVLNQELRVPLPVWEGLQGIAFADAGNVWTEVGNLSTDDLFVSLGLGLRAETPLGIVRLDFAVPLDARLEDDDYEIYFGLGHAF